jgi:carboxyl-terminal processing protease
MNGLSILGVCALVLWAMAWCPPANATPSDAATYDGGILVERTDAAVGRHYFDPSRVNPRQMLDLALEEIQKLVPDLIIHSPVSDQLSITAGLATKRIRIKPMNKLSDLSSTLDEVLDFVIHHYGSTEDIKPEEIEYAAIDGMLEALDPHSNFLTPKIYKEFRVGTSGKFGGLGIVISIKDGMLTVIAPLEGTPASAAGIEAGDRILQIDDESTINMSLTDAVNKLRGDVGSKVTILVERTGQPARKVTLKRAVINIESVQHSILTEQGKRIGYIKLKNFQDNSDDDVRAALASFHQDGAKIDGLVLDLRNNPGGLLNVASDITDIFLDKGTIVTTVGQRGMVMDRSDATELGTEPFYPIVVLINEGSASASEIVAGSLAGNDRAVIAGTHSFGKGSVQTIFNLGEDAALKLTIAEYKPAGTQSIQLIGITPDIELVPSTVDADAMNIVKDKLTTEFDLEMELSGKKLKKAEEEDSLMRLSYLKPKEDKKSLEEQSRKEYLKQPDLSGDFPVQFATRLIAEAGSSSRREMLKKSEPIVKAVQAEQQQSIDREITALGIDWSRGDAKGKPKLELTSSLIKDSRKISRARAGDKVRLELAATNKGTGSFYQLIGVGETDSPLLDGREFPFGKILPGQTRRFSTPIEIPESLSTQDLTMEISFKEGGGNIPEPRSVVVPIEEIPHPEFGFRMTLPTIGKGKAIPTDGKSVPLTIDISNIGKGASDEETVASISNECGEKFFIEQGRAKLGVIPSKGGKKAQFAFRINGTPDKDCAIKLTVADLKHLKILSKRIDLKLPAGESVPPSGKTYRAPTIVVDAFPTTTTQSTVVISGTLSDEDPIRDFYVFVGDKKIAYVPNATEVKVMPFKVAIPLEEGPNRIMIGARDVLDITGYRHLVIERVANKAASDKSTATSIPNFTP